MHPVPPACAHPARSLLLLCLASPQRKWLPKPIARRPWIFRFTIRTAFATTGEVLCPHSAVGVKVAEENLGTTPMITLATAHPAKFPDAVEQAMGARPGLPLRMADLFDRPERVTRVANDLAALQSIVRERTGR